MQNVLKNKYVLYAVSALAVLNVLGYLSIGSMECLGVFALTALVCQQYNKNMTICLLAAIFAANVIFGCGRIKENFAGKCGCGKKGCSGKENFTEGVDSKISDAAKSILSGSDGCDPACAEGEKCVNKICQAVKEEVDAQGGDGDTAAVKTAEALASQ